MESLRIQTWNSQFSPYETEYIETFFDQVDKDGRRYAPEGGNHVSHDQVEVWSTVAKPDAHGADQ